MEQSGLCMNIRQKQLKKQLARRKDEAESEGGRSMVVHVEGDGGNGRQTYCIALYCLKNALSISIVSELRTRGN